MTASAGAKRKGFWEFCGAERQPVAEMFVLADKFESSSVQRTDSNGSFDLGVDHCSTTGQNQQNTANDEEL